MTSSFTQDVSVVGAPKYARKELDFYPTPSSVTKAIVPYLPRDTTFWEPCTGTGAITKVLEEVNWTYNSDIHDYGYNGFNTFELDFLTELPNLDHIVCIVTNPPYDKSHEFVKRALEISQVEQAFFLLRHEWDASQKSLSLVSHPSFKCKYVLKRRPRWIEGTKTAPRFPYAWYEWDKNFIGKSTTVYGVE